jgi:hypothetical protein
MNRRDFLAASAVAGVAPLSQIESLQAQQGGERQFIEIRRYHMLLGARQREFTTFMGDVAVPAMNRAGVGPIGAFTVTYGENAPSLILVLTHKTMDSVVGLRERLAADAEYNRAGSAILGTPLGNPAFVRVQSSLLRAFANMPTVEPAPGAAARTPRIFEMRTYESHSDAAALLKRKMFNEGGEIAIFRKTGLRPVFFGETIIGDRMPSLTYMLTFADMAARDAAWAVFTADPEWRTLSADAEYRDTVSTITDVILRPTAFSQI